MYNIRKDNQESFFISHNPIFPRPIWFPSSDASRICTGCFVWKFHVSKCKRTTKIVGNANEMTIPTFSSDAYTAADLAGVSIGDRRPLRVHSWKRKSSKSRRPLGPTDPSPRVFSRKLRESACSILSEHRRVETVLFESIDVTAPTAVWLGGGGVLEENGHEQHHSLWDFSLVCR